MIDARGKTARTIKVRTEAVEEAIHHARQVILANVPEGEDREGCLGALSMVKWGAVRGIAEKCSDA
jgi:hypothetical protein